MDVLLDSNVMIWAASAAHKLPENIQKTLTSGEINCFVSMAAFWEIRIKQSNGKLEIPENFYTAFLEKDYQLLNIQMTDIEIAGKLPFHHRDPFDRMLIAQAINKNLAIITKDRLFRNYEVTLFPWH